MARNLREELTKSSLDAPHGNAGISYCALEQKLSCCDGLGFHLDTSSAYTRAEMCACVATCSGCFGSARQIRDGISIPCSEHNPGRIASLINAAEIPSRYGAARFDAFTNFTGNGRDVVSRVKRWVLEYRPGEGQGLILGGPVGVGKTYLLAATAKHLIRRGYGVRFVDFFQLLSELREAFSNEKSENSVLKPLIDVDILIIDELGKGRNNDWELTILDALVNRRYDQRKIIIASTNYLLAPENNRFATPYPKHLDALEPKSSFIQDQFESLETRVGKRIYSRLVEMTQFIELSGEDFRRRRNTMPSSMG